MVNPYSKASFGSQVEGRRKRRQEGVVLVWTVFTVFVLMGSIFVTATLARTSGVRAELAVDKTCAKALSHAAVEAAAATISDSLRISQEPPLSGTALVDGETVVFNIERAGTEISTKTAEGLIQVRSTFRVSGSGTSGGVTQTTRSMVQAAVIPIFQFAIFYENDIEFYNPAPWEIKGRVHTNSDIYIRTATDLTFDTNYIQAVGKMYGRATFGAWDPLAGQAAKIRRWVEDPFDGSVAAEFVALPTIEEFDGMGLTTTGGLDSDFVGFDGNGDGDFDDIGDEEPYLASVLDRWSSSDPAFADRSTLRSVEHGVQRLETPQLDDLDRFVPKAGGGYDFNSATGKYEVATSGTGSFGKGAFFEQAGLSIESFPDGSWRALDENGVDISSDLSSVITSDSIYDARQANGTGNQMRQIQVDMAALAATDHFPANGLLYLAGDHVGDGTGTDANAFTVKHAATLPGPLTLVSPDSLYVQGDYNTVNPKPAAAIGDAINLLSNAWDNSKGPGNLPVATETTYNLSIIAGDVGSTADHLSGGPHNLPRRHEEWSGVKEHLNGSIICPFRSRFATGKFELGGDYYLPPDRFWTYDENNNVVGNMPPFTPVSVLVQDVVSWVAKP